jgi:hypothetical protein
MQRRWYWKAYFFLGVVLSASLVVLLAAFSYFFPDKVFAPEMIAGSVSLPLYFVQLVGLHGFVYRRRSGYARLWQLVFAATVLETAWSFYSAADDLPDLHGFDAWFYAGFTLGWTALMTPLLVALFLYAFRSPRLWAEATLA